MNVNKWNKEILKRHNPNTSIKILTRNNMQIWYRHTDGYTVFWFDKNGYGETIGYFSKLTNAFKFLKESTTQG
jgi:hypothetical protein